MNPHFYRLRKETVRKDPSRKGDGEMRKGLPKTSPPGQQ